MTARLKVVQYVTFRIEHIVVVDAETDEEAIMEAEFEANEVEITCQITGCEGVESSLDYEYWEDTKNTEILSRGPRASDIPYELKDEDPIGD